MWDEIINATDGISTNVSVNVICTVAINVANAASKNFYNRNVEHRMNCYFAHGFMSVYITVYNCYYFLSLCKKYWRNTNIKMEIDELKKMLVLKIMVWKIIWNMKLIYGISCIAFIGTKLLRIRFDKIDGFVRIYDGSRYLVLLRAEQYNAIYDRIRHLISLKSGVTYVFSLNYAKIKFLWLFASRKTFTLYNIKIGI